MLIELASPTTLAQLPRRMSREAARGRPSPAVPRSGPSAPAREGRLLRDVLAEPGAASAMRATGAAIRCLHAQPLGEGIPQDIHGPSQQAALLAYWLERLIWDAPCSYAALGERARRVLEGMAELRTLPLRRIHGGLDDSQVVVGSDAAVMLAERDPVTFGEPAIDLANLAVHVDIRVRRGGGDPALAASLRSALLNGYGVPSRWKRRLEIYEEAARLRLACAEALGAHAGAPGHHA
ncbi:MAG: hypothetical protein QOE11_2666 [Solirubrobacteraceae bacterium]|jgi:hypothetical protein|nr:hypothetical protein [Solirubrobacteraceae bacterium]